MGGGTPCWPLAENAESPRAGAGRVKIRLEADPYRLAEMSARLEAKYRAMLAAG
jgi:hypothetical protein